MQYKNNFLPTSRVMSSTLLLRKSSLKSNNIFAFHQFFHILLFLVKHDVTSLFIPLQNAMRSHKDHL